MRMRGRNDRRSDHGMKPILDLENKKTLEIEKKGFELFENAFIISIDKMGILYRR